MSLTDQLTEQHARLAALKASEAELTDGPDAALKVLGSPTDPIRMRAALGILLRADRHQLAADLIGDQRVDDKWIDLASVTFSFLGDIARAQSLVDQADNSSDLSVMRSCRLGFAEGVIEKWREIQGDSLLAIPNWSEPDIDLARRTIEILDPLLALVRANRGISNDLELGAVTYAAYCAWVAGDREFLSQLTSRLVKYVPVPLVVAELCLRRLIQPPPENLPNRLRVEHAGEFQASYLAALVERELFRRAEAAFDSFVQLKSLATSDEEKESVCIALFETCGKCDPPQIQKTIELVQELRPGDSRLLGLLEVMKHIAEEKLPEAMKQLEVVRDETDGIWWQAKAQVLEESGDEEAAHQAWEKASELIPHPDVVRRSIKASMDRRKFESALRSLKKLLEKEPNNEQHLKMIAWNLVQVNDHAQAVNFLNRLVEINSSNHEYRIWLAQELARTARTEEAIAVLAPVCQLEDPPLEALLLQSKLLAASNEPREAFRLLEAIAPDHWDQPPFLMAYMQRGYAAGEDRLAQEAFVRVLDLRRQGKVPPELIQEGTLEQLLEHAKNFRNQREALQNAMIAGRMPWLFAEDYLGNPPTWAWAIHTQELNWLSEEPLTRAGFSVYATNGFTVQSTPNGKRLMPISASEEGKEVVADLSALLTLYHLGRLTDAAHYFAKLVLPSSYGDLRVRYADRFSQHQTSREAELKRIRELVEAHRIHLESECSPAAITIDEYADEPERHVYRFQDIIHVLKSAQKTTPYEIAELTRIAHKPAGAVADRPALTLGQKVLIDSHTLRTLVEQPAFEAILDSLSVSIRATEYDTLVAEIHAHEAARAAKQAHDDLWQAVAELVSGGAIRWEPMPVEKEADEEAADASDHSLLLDAARLSQHLRIPLLADDRVLQVLRYSGNMTSPSEAFGSDCVLRVLQEKKVRDAASTAADYRRLMQWRYRFLAPSGEVLFAWAEESLDNLPGPALLEAAFYLHDCLRDGGLHCGPEQSEPPMPMAIKFVISWMSSVVSLLTRVWNDKRFSNEVCSGLTLWVGEELIPSVPRGLWYHEHGHNTARSERCSVFNMAMVQFTSIEDQSRANLALRALAESVGISDEGYLAAVANAIRISVDKEASLGPEAKAEKAFSSVMMQNALFHLADTEFDALDFSRFRALGFFEGFTPPSLPDSLPDSLLKAARSADSQLPSGPLVFIPEEKSATVIEADTLLLHPVRELRRAALAYLLSGDRLNDPWLTPHTISLLKGNAPDIESDDESRWLGAAVDVVTVIREDLFGQLAGFRQSVAFRYQEGTDSYAARLLRPAFNTLLNFRPPVWNPSTQIEEIESWIVDASKLPTLEEALSKYVGTCGYVPLSAELGASKVVRLWVAEHRDGQPKWEELWAWAVQEGTPVAKYHAITVALNIPELRPESESDKFWTEVVSILEIKEVANGTGESHAQWQLHCELASHFARHIETLHPGQFGDAVACYAWWLSENVGRLIGGNEKAAKWALEHAVMPEARYSYFRWTVARSPVVPSPFRYATLHSSSVWAMSLLAQLGSAVHSFTTPGISKAVQEVISNVLHGYLLISNLAEQCEMVVLPFAIQDDGDLEKLSTSEGYVPDESRESLSELIAFHRHLSAPEVVESYLGQFPDLPEHAQHMILLALKGAVYSTNRFDSALAKWLEQTDLVVGVLKTVPEPIVDILMEVFAEFQQHQVSGWPIRLPHLLSFTIEGLDDPNRMKHLVGQVLQMSINGGVGSPIQRLTCANRFPDCHSVLGNWRGNLVEMARHSEPWIAARVRAISSVVSQIIGPRKRNSG